MSIRFWRRMDNVRRSNDPWRAEEQWAFRAEALDADHLVLDLPALLAFAQLGEHEVAFGVVLDREAGPNHMPQRGRERVQGLADDEERRRDVLALEGAHDCGCVGAGPVVEGQCDLAPAGAARADVARVGKHTADRATVGLRLGSGIGLRASAADVV
jgi:hypothetical protein